METSDTGFQKKEKIIMAIRGDRLIYIADGDAESMDKLKKSFGAILSVPVVEAEVVDGMNIKELKENPVLLNDTFKELIE